MRACIALALAVAGCSPAPLTELLVVADTDLAVPDALTGVRFVVEGPRGDVQEASVDFAAGDARPAVLALVHRGGPLGPLTVEVIGERGTQEVLTRTARVDFVSGQVLGLKVVLRAGCVGVACGEGETCGELGCRSIDVEPDELAPWAPADAGVMDASGCACDDGVACTIDVCRDGGCVHVPDPSACGDDGLACTSATCDVQRGCVHEPDDVACDDAIACTADSCDGELGCVSEPSDAACHDGVACTVDRCDGELGCVSTPDDAACDDGVACTVDRCGASGCERTPSHASCAPGELCDAEEGCERGPSFTEVYAFFESRCTSCHGGSDPDGDLDLSTPSVAWASLVDVPARCDGSPRVAPGNARASLLWRKVARTDLCGDRMPPSGPPASGSDAALIERWIDAGALND